MLVAANSRYRHLFMRRRSHNEVIRLDFTCFALAIFAALGITFSKNVFTLSYSADSPFSTYPLVTHYGDDEAKRGGRVYGHPGDNVGGSLCLQSS